jgi:ATP-binding cassette subfamily B multidrug efflux pump
MAGSKDRQTDIPFPLPGPRRSEPLGENAERAKDTRGTVLRLWGYLKRQHMALVAVALMALVSVGLDLLGPYLLGRAVDTYILRHDLVGLAHNCCLMLGVAAVNALLNWLSAYIMAGVAQRTVRDLRSDLFTRLQDLPLHFFDTRPHGDLMSRLTNDVDNVNQILSGGVTQVVSGLLSTVGITIVMLLMNVRLTVVSLTTIVVLTLGLSRWVARHIGDAFRRQQETLGRLNGMIEETITGQRIVKAYRREPTVIAQFDAANAELRQAATGAQIFAASMGPMMNTVGNLGLAVVAGVGGVLVLRGLATVGTIAAFINYTRQFGRPLNDIANLYNMILVAVAGAERVFEVIDEPREVDVPNAPLLERIRGEVIFENVAFSYSKGVPVLRDLSLHARPGQVIALIGPTGAGKTTIINMLTRFYEIGNGRITLDGRDIHTIRKEDLRRQFGIVLQDTFLFAGSVRDNIRYGRLDASEEDVIAAAHLANADQFIYRLPYGYDTHLSERGGNLSQGQRQLIAIARAILADPRILILDEATSSVDTRTEKHLQEAMRHLMAGRTCFVIAHRLSTIREADQILVISHGTIMESGTHDELLARNGLYHRLSARPRVRHSNSVAAAEEV